MSRPTQAASVPSTAAWQRHSPTGQGTVGRVSDLVRLSVVVPVYNGEKYLKECLDSIANAVLVVTPERRSELEVIICDNHSTDASWDIAAAARFACLNQIVRPGQHEDNRTRNWRAGLAAATGTWVMLLHADDLLAPGGLDALLEATDSPAAIGAALVVGRHRTFEVEGSPSELHPRWILPSIISGPRLASAVLPFHCPFVPFILMRSALYDEVGGLDDRWQLVQDWELWMRLVARGDVYFVPREIGWWRLHGSSPAYMRMNAREHVQLAAVVDQSVGAISANDMTTAQSVALARAAVHLRAASGDADGDADGEPWLGGRHLPSPQEAEASLNRMGRRVAVTQAALRAAGLLRWLYRRAMPSDAKPA